MSHEHSEKPKRPVGAERPFPWRCRRCGKDAVVPVRTSYDLEERPSGQAATVFVEIPTCQSCGERVFTEKVDAQINAALRASETSHPAAR